MRIVFFPGLCYITGMLTTADTDQTLMQQHLTAQMPLRDRTENQPAFTPDIYSRIPILVVDDDAAVRKSIRRALEGWGCNVSEAANGRIALEMLQHNSQRLVLSDIDMPEFDGFDLLDEIRARFSDCGVIMVSGMAHEQIIDAALERGAIGYVQKPYRVPELKSQVTYALRKLVMTGNDTVIGIPTVKYSADERPTDTAREFARLFAMTSNLHHIETGAHVRRIGRLSRAMAIMNGMRESHADLLGEAAVLHDIGKLAIPDAILKKPGPLTSEEFEIMKTHPVLGGQILSKSRDPLLRLAHTVALHHHERWDGTGYPHNLKGDACALEARIVGIVDVYDALTEKRVYKEPWPRDRVTDFFREKSGSAFEPALVDLLLIHYDQFEAIRLTEDKDDD